ncbi:hypothetical protein TrVE_jg6769 [Triparma verrucosa]|uniref:Ubiquitin-like protease family profile domain-containing protein n=1 Tax=Triparma verrucosa TaxID=1606542 RepID=A0A9W7EVC6_9STRA|nr:hypothetical protein TrVE_jg6769 [Triparma verrucosa]
MNNPQIYASQGDSFVYKSDLRLLQHGNWLNDNLISFYLECLTSKFNVSNLRVIDSAVVSFLVNQLDEEEEDFQSECSSMDIFESGNSNFLIPVNSSYASSETFGEVGAGNHWSLLHIVILEAQVSWKHYDSSPSLSNSSAAFRTLSKFMLCYKTARKISIGNAVGEDIAGNQTDGWRCGWYVLGNCSRILQGQEGGEDGEGLAQVREEMERFLKERRTLTEREIMTKRRLERFEGVSK